MTDRNSDRPAAAAGQAGERSEDVEPDQREQLLAAQRGARASGTPFLSFCTPERMAALVREAGFRDTSHVPAEELAGRYFAGRADGLRPSRGEEILVALT
ncbi:hypothetical protein [Streptomyces sp. NPDC048386]|uniref:hypothetical protein n=1 Tax=Streptomyces sp. NPDC048386 TaxID=3365541 RepID=UPI0037239C60